MANVKIYNTQYDSLQKIDWDFSEAVQDPLSSIHPYPAKFINLIPKSLIEIIGCPKDSVILDPFCGSGTTLIEAQRHGFESVGIDLNPIACLISKVKTTPLPDSFPNIVENIAQKAEEAWTKEIPIPSIPNLDHWFDKDIQKAISSILSVIEHQQGETIKNALKLALSSIIVRVSRQESDTRYAAVEKNNQPSDVFKSFSLAARKIYQANALNTDIYSNNARVLFQDVLTVNTSQIGNNIGLVITSPPYPNAYEYWLYHKYRMWWLGFNPVEVRTYEIGARPHYQKKNGQTEKDFYRQMDQVFNLLVECLRKNGHICFVVGRSIIAGRIIDNGELIRTIGETHGLDLVADITREIAATKKSFNLKYGKIREENILVFRKGT